MNIKERFDNVGFTPEEKLDLTARLERAAEQEDDMTNATKRKIKRISGSMVFGIAAAVVMTAGALAAVVSPGLRDWFDTTAPGASEALESSIYRIDRSETYNGWTVTLAECAGDENGVYIWVDITAPEGTVLAAPEGAADFDLDLWCDLENGEGDRVNGMSGSCGVDEDPTDNRYSKLLDISLMEPRDITLQEVTTIRIRWIAASWTAEDPETGEPRYERNGTLTEAIRDHEWVFENVKLDFPDQTVRAESNVAVPWLDGTATVTKLEISPTRTLLELEGGSCATYIDFMNEKNRYTTPVEGSVEETLLELDGLIVTGGPMNKIDPYWINTQYEMRAALTVSLAFQDGTQLTPNMLTLNSGYKEGAEGPETPYINLELKYDYTAMSKTVDRMVNPALIDHVTVCGVDIPVAAAPEARPEAARTSIQTPAPGTATGVVTPGKGLNIRSGPGTGYQVLSTARKGAQVTILGEEQGFYQVACPDGTTGYASKKYISPQ